MLAVADILARRNRHTILGGTLGTAGHTEQRHARRIRTTMVDSSDFDRMLDRRSQKRARLRHAVLVDSRRSHWLGNLPVASLEVGCESLRTEMMRIEMWVWYTGELLVKIKGRADITSSLVTALDTQFKPCRAERAAAQPHSGRRQLGARRTTGQSVRVSCRRLTSNVQYINCMTSF